MTAQQLKVWGVVQGVGFRPFIYRLAQKYLLHGWVLNDSQGVIVHWEGPEENIELALDEMLAAPPPQAQITGYDMQPVEFRRYKDFIIKESAVTEGTRVLIPADIGTCSQCQEELRDAQDRRYAYPFINCTDCGPRYSIIQGTPYDRQFTTMAGFIMCSQCLSEYKDPENRRFHAQPNACPVCGPHVTLLDRQGEVTKGDIHDILKEGKIVAIKGLGGFHLACNALDNQAVARLRHAKKRNAKPFALMARDIESVKKFCLVSEPEEERLLSPVRPIVVLTQREAGGLPEEVNPGLDSLGLMLPYTPLHYLLFDGELSLLVMTSANLSGNPMIVDNHEAVKQLQGIADYYVIHNRDIENPCDDSVGMMMGDRWQLLRRARGYVPLPVQSSWSLKNILACGADLKNTFALGQEKQVFLSQHGGDLDNYLNYQEYCRAVPKMISLLGIQPELIIHDLHPGYRTTDFAKEMTENWETPALAVQHHHAHMASCMADNEINEEVLAVICDGTGYGPDGALWGFEFLSGDFKGYTRWGHLAYVPLPGGEVAIRKTDRMAFGFLASTLGEEGERLAEQILPQLSPKERAVLRIQLKNRINTPLTSSCGRLFDAAAALLGICHENEYEGQGPIQLEMAAVGASPSQGHYPMVLIQKPEGTFELDSAPLWRTMTQDLLAAQNVPAMAYRFHLGIAHGIREGVRFMAEKTGLKKVVLSGGVFQNKMLLMMVKNLLDREKMLTFSHRQVPTNDGGLSLGQVLVGNEGYKKCV